MLSMVMAGTSNSKCPTVAKEEDPSMLSPSYEYSSGYYGLEWQFAIPMQEGIIHATFPFEEESFTSNTLYQSLDIVEYNNPTDNIYLDHGISFGEKPIRKDSAIKRKTINSPIRKQETVISNMSSASKALTREIVSKYFYMPISEAAKQLDVGLTLMKKRCRELGIHRWPHRKLMSLQTLIRNVQELNKAGGEGSEEKLREAIEVLEKERKQLEESPDTLLGTKTKRLRQACFKANYKKRKLISTNTTASFEIGRSSTGPTTTINLEIGRTSTGPPTDSSNSPIEAATATSTLFYEEDDYNEEIKSLLSYF